jgi:hypothetical protein
LNVPTLLPAENTSVLMNTFLTSKFRYRFLDRGMSTPTCSAPPQLSLSMEGFSAACTAGSKRTLEKRV